MDPSQQSTLTWLREAVSQRIEHVLDGARSRHGDIGSELAPVWDVAGSMAGGGKRLRAAFAYLGWISAAGQARSPVIVQAGAGLEMFHLAALVHDDLIDDSDTRRGAPSAHHRFARVYEESEMAGGARRFASAGAILLGDLLVVLSAHELAGAAAATSSEARASRELIADMMAEVTLGQYLDIVAQSMPWSQDPAVDVDRAHRVVRSKSARYSIEHPLLLGAALAGASAQDLTHGRSVGLPIGEAFQLRDDLLGVFGDPEVTGKPSGDDLREGKRTVLVTTALHHADPDQAQWLRSALGTALSEQDVQRARGILTDSGAVAAVENLISEHVHRAEAAVAAAPWPHEARDLARDLARAATVRTT